MEIWKNVNLPLFHDKYMVSNYGRVKIKNGRIIKKSFDSDGYYKVCLYYNKIEKTITIHRLVALTFLYNDYKEGYVVNHKDGVKTNNNVENLEFVTVRENTVHAYKNNLIKTGYLNKKSKHIALYDSNHNLISQYETVKDLEKCTKISRRTIIDFYKKNKINICYIDEIDFNKPVNVELRKHRNKINNPIKLMNNNKEVIAVYSSISEMERATSISRRISTKFSYEKEYKYKKRGRNYKNIYYILKINVSDYLSYGKNIIDKKINIT